MALSGLKIPKKGLFDNGLSNLLMPTSKITPGQPVENVPSPVAPSAQQDYINGTTAQNIQRKIEDKTKQLGASEPAPLPTFDWSNLNPSTKLQMPESNMPAPDVGGTTMPTSESTPIEHNVEDTSINESKPMNLFKDEQDAFQKMKGDGLEDSKAFELLKQRRKDLMEGNTDLTPIESAALLKMQQDGLTTEESLNALKQFRESPKEDTRPLWKKLGEGAINLGAGNLNTILKYGGNLLDLGTGGTLGIGEDVNKMNETNKETYKDSNAYKVGEYLPDVALTVAPLGATVGGMGLIKGGATVGAGFGALQPVLESNQATIGDVVKGGAEGGITGAVTGGLLKGLGKGAEKFIQGAKEFNAKPQRGAIGAFTEKISKEDAQLIKDVHGDFIPGIVDGQEVMIRKPTGKSEKMLESIKEGITTPFRADNPRVLAGRAIAPTISGLSDAQKLTKIENVEKQAKSLWSKVRTGEFTGNIDTLGDTAKTIVDNLKTVGDRIGKAIEGVDGEITLNPETIDSISNVLKTKTAKLSKAYGDLSDFYTVAKDPMTIKEAQEIKGIFSDAIQELTAGKKTKSDQYRQLVKGVDEINTKIENIIDTQLTDNTFKTDKENYALLKNMVKDVVNSSVVEARRSPMTFTEQMGTINLLIEAVTSPGKTIANLYAKEIGEMNTRGGSWKRLMEIYDKGAINNVGKEVKVPGKDIITPNVPIKPTTPPKKPLTTAEKKFIKAFPVPK